MATTTEVERKYDVPVDFTVPDLGRLPAVAAVDEPTEHRLDATYYDTTDLRLAANHVTLRRRSGGNDAGWHIKRPTEDGERTEEHAPLTRATVGPVRDSGCARRRGPARGATVGGLGPPLPRGCGAR